jgi:hypothetical protein
LPNPLRAPFASTAQTVRPVNSGSPWAAMSRPPLPALIPLKVSPVLAGASQPPAASQSRPRNLPDQHRPPPPPARRGPATSVTPAPSRPHGRLLYALVKLSGLSHAASDHWIAASTTHLHRRPPASAVPPLLATPLQFQASSGAQRVTDTFPPLQFHRR